MGAAAGHYWQADPHKRTSRVWARIAGEDTRVPGAGERK
jgi:hypothetical protein